ncbi:hypothetical protein BC832DRAFT_554286 [Gaertneriomyces semiglobifer]|nr:hypothetical protein BC832DRAFT_554286 [Gaertneriomyces semiglobifer]
MPLSIAVCLAVLIVLGSTWALPIEIISWHRNITSYEYAPPLQPRAEENQPTVTNRFPHTLGYDRLRLWMNDRVDPCDDFWMYACGGFIDENKELGDVDVLQLMQMSNSKLMESVLEQSVDSIGEGPLEKELFAKTKSYYQSCRNSEAIKNRGLEPLIAHARSIIAYTAHDNNTDLPLIFANLHQDAIEVLFRTEYTKVPNHDPTDLRLIFSPASAYEVQPSTVKKVLEPILRMNLLDDFDATSDLDSIADWIVKIELESVKFIAALDAENIETDGLAPSQFMVIDQLNTRTQQDWRTFTRQLGLNNADRIYLYGDAEKWIDAFTALAKFDRQALRFYFLWRLGVSHFNKLSAPYHDLWLKEVATAEVVSVARGAVDAFQNDCLTELGNYLSYLSGHIFVKYAFNATQKDAATDLVNNLVQAFRSELQTLEWMDDATRTAAVAKVDNIVEVVGYPDWLIDTAEVAEYHANLVFSVDSYYENAVKAQAFSLFASSIRQIGSTFARKDLYFGFPWQLNAFSHSDRVQIQINPGILQRPLFSSLNPRAMNYGALGMIVGHEITHGFDDEGHKLDKDGVLRPWWSNQSVTSFQDESACFIRQYDQYKLPNGNSTVKIDGLRTLGENISDNGGYNVALAAWRSAEAKARQAGIPDPDEDKRGNFTPEQVFHIALAQTWCSTTALGGYSRENSVHSPKTIRTRGILENSADFAKAFSCPVGSGMNPRPDGERCRLY